MSISSLIRRLPPFFARLTLAGSRQKLGKLRDSEVKVSSVAFAACNAARGPPLLRETYPGPILAVACPSQ